MNGAHCEESEALFSEYFAQNLPVQVQLCNMLRTLMVAHYTISIWIMNE